MNLSALNSSRFQESHVSVSPLKDLAAKKLETATKIDSADKVTLSVAGLNAASTASPSSVEAYALPSWFGDFQVEMSDLSYTSAAMEETRRYTEFSEKLIADGHLSQADQRAMQAYISNSMPATQYRKELELDFNRNKNLYEEFGAIKEQHLQSSLDEYNIKTADDWREKIMNQPGHNQELRMNIMEKMLNDPRAVELMQQLKIKQPKV